MLAILSGILGFATSGLPSILGFFQQRGDQKHERDMAKLQNEQALLMAEKGFVAQEKIAAIELEGTYAETYAQERVALYDHDKKLIDLGSGIRDNKKYLYYEYDHVFTKQVPVIYHNQFFCNNQWCIRNNSCNIFTISSIIATISMLVTGIFEFV